MTPLGPSSGASTPLARKSWIASMRRHPIARASAAGSRECTMSVCKPALHPASALREPRGRRGRRLLVGRGGERVDREAEPRDAQPEVGVPRHVPRVPAADRAQDVGAKMVGRAAEQEAARAGRRGRIDDVEQDGVFDGLQRGQPTVVGIVDRRRAWRHASVAGAAANRSAASRSCSGSGSVLRIKDRHQRAARRAEPDVERARLGARRARRRDDESHSARAGSARARPRPSPRRPLR